jgi:kynurenine 3-monooxygenase
MQKNIAICGAGLVGSLLACYLAKRGHQVTVFERRPDMRKSGLAGGRSINLALSHRGWKALQAVGLSEAVSKIAIPMQGRMIHDLAGQISFFPYGEAGQAIYSVSRADLNRIMIEQAEKFEGITFTFNKKCTGIDFERNILTVQDTVTQEKNQFETEVIFGTDGAYSEVRYEMQKTPNFNLLQQHESYGYKELTIPAGNEARHLIDKNSLHIWPRESFMMIALPNLDGSFTVTLFAPFKGANSFEIIQSEEAVLEYFTRHFPDALGLMPGLAKDFFINPTSSLVTIKCFPWLHKQTCLLGDAAHAVAPFYGQGMNCGFEDVFELNNLLDSSTDNWTEILTAFQQQRKPNADAIADLALSNFIEMRDLSGRPDFQLRVKIEKRIAALFPNQFITHYSMVTFSDLSYAEAKRRGEQQNELLDSIMEIKDIQHLWDSDTVTQMAASWMAKNRP